MPTTRTRIVLLAISVAAAALVASAEAGVSAESAYPHSYVDELFIDHALEGHGIYVGYRNIAADNASCIGLRRFGVRTSSDGYSETFWRFRCDVNAANNHTYDVQLSTTTGPRRGNVYWHFLSVRKLF